jgi:hypothetical protein
VARTARAARRIAAIVALGTGLAWGGPARPAAAHVCSVPSQVPVGVRSALNFGVANDLLVPAVAADIKVPDGLHVESVDPATGWQAAVDGQVVHLTGGPIEPVSGCAYFTARATAARKGLFLLRVHARGADMPALPGGATDVDPAQPVLAGIRPGEEGSDTTSTGGTGPGRAGLVAGGVAAAGGVAGGAGAGAGRARPAASTGGRPVSRPTAGCG